MSSPEIFNSPDRNNILGLAQLCGYVLSQAPRVGEDMDGEQMIGRGWRSDNRTVTQVICQDPLELLGPEDSSVRFQVVKIGWNLSSSPEDGPLVMEQYRFAVHPEYPEGVRAAKHVYSLDWHETSFIPIRLRQMTTHARRAPQGEASSLGPLALQVELTSDPPARPLDRETVFVLREEILKRTLGGVPLQQYLEMARFN